MGGGNAGNLKVADRCYAFLQENGPKTVSEMKDYLNELKGRGRSPRGVTSEQLANVMRCSPLFRVVGTDFIHYGKGTFMVPIRGTRWKRDIEVTNNAVKNKGSTPVNLYDIVPIEEVIEKLRGKKHLVRKRWPKVLKDALKKEKII